MSAATLSYLPWLRRGLSTSLQAVDDGNPSGPRGIVRISLDIGPGPLSNAVPLETDLVLYGPGDVRALDSRAVVRTWPRADVFEAEPNYFPLIELTPADLPWRFTPARANPQDRLRPWLCLVVLADDEIEAWEHATSSRPVETVTVRSGASLPDPAQAWAWAHVQVSGASSVDAAMVIGLMESEPQRLVARLLCPRRLDPRTAYTALLVPCLERARLAGLGMEVADSIDGLAPAWSPTSTSLVLPVYHRFRFTTAESGDFESLARKIAPKVLPSSVGMRPLDVSSPGLGLPPAASTPLLVESALRTIDAVSGPWDPGERALFSPRLEELLNRPADLLATTTPLRVVAPPLYGQWPARQSRLDTTSHPWFQTVNGDPRLRVGAGVGAEAVRRDREAILAAAWRQVDAIRAANELLRLSQLAREVSLSVFERHVESRALTSYLMFTAPLHARVKASPTTIREVLSHTALSIGVLDPVFRRVTRPLGPLGKRAKSTLASSTLLERLERGELVVAPAPDTPSTMATPERTGTTLGPDWAFPPFLTWLAKLTIFELIAVAIVLFFLAAVQLVVGARAAASGLAALGLSVLGFVVFGRPALERWLVRAAVRAGSITPEQVATAPARGGFVPTELDPTRPPPARPNGRGAEDPSARAFRLAAASVFADLRAPLTPAPERRRVDLAELRPKLASALNPRVTILDGVRARLNVAASIAWATREDPLDPIMAAPEFPQPTCPMLTNISTDWVFAGLDEVPADSATLLRTNQRFIEGFMLGMNHETARLLLYAEFPTDQMGTYWPQFWDSTPAILRGEDPETLKDIRPLHGWRRTELGVHSARNMPPGGDFLVLLLRAELLRRFPNTIVYAARARWTATGTREILPGEESWPVFQGGLADGVRFWGFELSASQVRGGPLPSNDPGWFFVLQEHSDEARFGLDIASTYAQPVTSWNDISWGSVAADETALSTIVHLDLDADLPDTRPLASSPARWHATRGLGPSGATAADLAFITYQRPVRVAIHASRLVPTS